MKLNNRINESRQGGFLASVDIKQGQHGPYGNIVIAVDDGYYKKEQNGQRGEWVDRKYFFPCDVSGKDFANLQVGDYLEIEGHLIMSVWQDSTGQRQAMKIKSSTVLNHIPKVACECLKQAGLYGKPKQSPQPQQPQYGQPPAQRPQQSQPQQPQPQYGAPPAEYPDYQGDNAYGQPSMPPQQGGWGNGQRPSRRAPQ